MTFLSRVFAVFLVLMVGLMVVGCAGIKPSSNQKANLPLKQATIDRLRSMDSSPAMGTLVRIFKESSELEVWKQTTAGTYRLFQTYEICAWSGELGPKVKEGDRQSPEGFYSVTPALLNPNSSYYLSFDTGFPNKFDRAYGRTGTNLMVHGDCSSRGCYSMTDEAIAEIYGLLRESFKGGNPSVQLQIFPFRMTPANLAKYASSPHLAFWQNIKEGYDRFEIAKTPPNWDVCEKRYVFDVPRTGAQALEAAAACPMGMAGGDTLVAALQQKQAADNAAMQGEVANIAAKQAKAEADAAKAAAEQAAAKARGEAIGSFVGDVAGSVGGLFGGGGKDAGVTKVVNPALVAPVPAPRKQRG